MPPAKRYLVTGGTGFIGAALVRALVALVGAVTVPPSWPAVAAEVHWLTSC